MAQRDLYALLDAPRDSSPDQLRRCYELAAARANREGAFRQLVDIAAAFDVLSDPGRRRLYDERGLAVGRERVPATHSAAVAFRGGRPGLGQTPVPGAGASGWARARRAQQRMAQRASRPSSPYAPLGSVERYEKGALGEELIAEALSPLCAEGWVLLNDRAKPGSPANVDHVLVGPPGVFVIDAKNWTGGRLRVDDRGLAVGRWRKDDELQGAQQDADVVRHLLRQVAADVRVVGVIAVVHDMGVGRVVEHHGVTIAERTYLLAWLRSLPAHIDSTQVHRLGGLLEAWLPPKMTPSRSRTRTSTSSRARQATAPVRSRSGHSGRRRRPEPPSRHGALRVAAASGAASALLIAAPRITPLMQSASRALIQSILPSQPPVVAPSNMSPRAPRPLVPAQGRR